MENIKVSIIVPCYNQGKYLHDTLDSVMKMTYDNWECVIINDGSTDDTAPVALKYASKDKRFRYIYQENQGVCVAKNNAIRESIGKYILPLDSDDMIAETFVARAVDHMEQNENCKLVYSNVKYFGAKKGVQNHNYKSFRNLLHLNCFCNSCLFRRTDFDQTEGYHPNMKGGWEDWDFWISLLKPTKGEGVFKMEMVGLYYRIKPNTRNNVGSLGKSLLRNMWKNHPDVYDDEIIRTWRNFDDIYNSRLYNVILFMQKMKRKLF